VQPNEKQNHFCNHFFTLNIEPMKKHLFLNPFLFLALFMMFNLPLRASELLNDELLGVNAPLTAVSNDPSSSTSDEIDGPGKPDKKKKSKHKKLSRRKCIYCPPIREFKKGQWEASFASGLVSTFLMDDVTVKMPPLSLGADYRITERISLGASIGSSISESQPRMVAHKAEDAIYATWTTSQFVVGIRPGIHLIRNESWDFYGGFSLGFNFSNISGQASQKTFDLEAMEKHLGIHQHVLTPSFFGYTGVKYVINPKWMAYSEVGFGISIFSVGVNYLLN
jgi:hypothetical protein